MAFPDERQARISFNVIGLDYRITKEVHPLLMRWADFNELIFCSLLA
jgi:hypothetical protein